MIEISHELTHIGIHFKDVFCCDCFFDETHFLLRQKSSYEIFEERSNLENCYFEYGFSTIIIVCHDILRLKKIQINRNELYPDKINMIANFVHFVLLI